MATTPTPNPATSPLSVDEFASRIKTKYPEYAGLDNATLASKVVAKYPEYKGKVALPAQANADNTGIVGPDQTAPNAGLAPPAGANRNIVPDRSVGLLSTNFYDKDFNPVNEVNQPRPAKFGEGVFKSTAGNAQQGLENLGIEEGPNTPVSGSNVLKGTNKLVKAGLAWSAPLAVTSGAAAPLKTAAVLGSGILGGKLSEKAASIFSDNPDVQEFAGNAGGLVTGGVMAHQMFKTPPLAKVTTPTQESAFNVLHPENAVAKESILPEVRNAAAQQGIGKVPKGRAGIELPQRVIQGSIDNHEAQVQAIKAPYRGAVVDNSSVVNAALSKITSEMRAAAAAGDSGVQKSISQIEAVAERARNANTLDLTDQLRHSWNDELSSELGKSAASQDVSPAATQAKRTAASALRSNMYDRLADLSGRDDVRSLAQREGALIEAKAGLAKTADAALKSRRNDLGENPRFTATKRAALKVQLTRPASVLKALPDLIQAMVDPHANTPAGQYQNRVARSLSNLGPATPDAPLYSTPNPSGLLPAGPTELGPSSIGNSTTPIPPIASTTRVQRLGVTPPGAGGTFEHVPYNSQANASTLPDGIRVPRQIGAGPDIRGLLPPQVESAIGLPEKSQSTLTNGRALESPASNEGVIPALIRDYVNGNTPTEHPDVTAMKNATAHNSPSQAAEFNERGAQQLFGRPYGTLSVPERLQAIRKGTALQTEATRTGSASGHSNIGGGSLEELNRGTTLKINAKTGVTGVHGGSIDIGNGEAVLRQRPDGSLEVANNNSGLRDSEILARFGRNAAETYGKPGRAPNTIELIHSSGEHGDVPLNRVSDYLASGHYRLAPRR